MRFQILIVTASAGNLPEQNPAVSTVVAAFPSYEAAETACQEIENTIYENIWVSVVRMYKKV